MSTCKSAAMALGIICCAQPMLIFGNNRIAKPVLKIPALQILQAVAPEIAGQNSEVATVDSLQTEAVAHLLADVNKTLHTSISLQGVDLYWEAETEIIGMCQIEKWNGSGWELLGKVQKSKRPGHTAGFLFHDATAEKGSNIYRICIAQYQNSGLFSQPTLAFIREQKSLLEVAIKSAVVNNGKSLQITSAYHCREAGRAFLFDCNGHFLKTLELQFDGNGIALINLEKEPLQSGNYLCLCNTNIFEAIRL